jgi:O-antigen ligase
MATLNSRFIAHVKQENSFLRRFVLVCLLAALLSTALVYPLRIPNILLAQLDASADEHRDAWGNLYLGQLRSIIAFNHAPLVIKECVSSVFLVASMCFFLLYLLRTISVQSAEQNQFSVSGKNPQTKLRSLLAHPFFWAGGFLLFAAISVFLWSPTPHHSLWTLLLCALVLGSAWVISVLSPSWSEIQKFMVAVALAGCLISFISFLQHIEAAWWFLPRFDDPRNRVGSLIGHNTGLSAYLLFPLSFSVSLWFIARRRLTRLFIALSVMLVLFVLVAAQSRAIWAIGTVMVIAQSAVLLRGVGARVRLSTFLLAAIAILFLFAAVQSIAPSVNPLARHAVRLSERLRRDFSPAQLAKETRLRIFVVSVPLVVKSPLIGHGLGAFQYVYPPAHGEYFLRHPDSILGTTVRRTDVAHNDYLQLVVETGFIGTALLLTSLVLVLRRVRRAYRALPWEKEKILLTGLIAPTAAIAVHAFFDFPFHVHPLAFTAVTSLALSYAGATRVLQPTSQLGRGASCAPRRSALAALTNETDAGSAEQESRAFHIEPASNFRPSLVLSLVAVVSAWLASPLAFELLLREFISDTLLRDASNWVSTAQSLATLPGGAKYQALDNAKELYRRAVKINVFNGTAMEGLAAAQLLSGSFDSALWLELRDDPSHKKAAEAIRLNATRALTSAVEYANLAMERGELRYHYTYYLIGQAYHLLAKLYPERSEYLESARRAFEQAVGLNNADVASLQELADVYEEQQPPNYERARALRRRIFEVDPDFGTRRFLLPVDDAARRGRFSQAWRSLNKISDVVGEHWSVQFAKARLYLKEALWPPPALDVATTTPEARRWFESRYRLARALADELAPLLEKNPVYQRFRLELLAAGGETTDALGLADRLLLSSEVRDPELDVLRYELGLRANSPRSLRWVEQGSAEFWYYRQRLRTLLLGPVALGSAQLANLVRADSSVLLKLDEGLRAADYLKAAGQWEYVSVIANNLARTYPTDPDVKKLLETVKAKSH